MKTKYTIENSQKCVIAGLNCVTYFSRWPKSSSAYVAQCIDHDICAQGNTREEAEKYLLGCISAYRGLREIMPEPPPKNVIQECMGSLLS